MDAICITLHNFTANQKQLRNQYFLNDTEVFFMYNELTLNTVTFCIPL